MASYVKIYGNQLIRSTVWVNTDKETRLVWITMLAIADKHGLVLASIPGLAKDAGVSVAECERALDVLRSPDKYSRTKEYEGRRVEDMDGGWLLLNYKKYREMRTEAQVKDAERKAAWRAKQSSMEDTGHVTGHSDVPPCPTPSRTTPTPTPTPSPKAAAARVATNINYVQECVIALNDGMSENQTVEGGWIPISSSSQQGKVTWEADGIPLDIALEVITKRTKSYPSTAAQRGPRSLRYFDAAIREAWEGSKTDRSINAVSEALSR